MSFARTLLVASIILSGACIDVFGQTRPSNIRPPRRGPAVSPYLSLLNRNNSLAFNYYELYRPQVEFRQAYQELNRDVGRLEERVDRQEAAFQRLQLGPTGHQTSFLNYGGYFPGIGGR
ncbi:MAG TPA: hypothetical protein VF170_05610 [Planctomycetaceae bacterium]